MSFGVFTLYNVDTAPLRMGGHFHPSRVNGLYFSVFLSNKCFFSETGSHTRALASLELELQTRLA